MAVSLGIAGGGANRALAQTEPATDLSTRIDSLEKQLADLKSQMEAQKAAAAVPIVDPVAPPIQPVAEVVVAPPKPAPIPKEFPQPREIPVGSERDNIAERFGQPALATTTTSDDGRVMETLVYARKSGRDVTLIRIEDGKVSSAHSH